MGIASFIQSVWRTVDTPHSLISTPVETHVHGIDNKAEAVVSEDEPPSSLHVNDQHTHPHQHAQSHQQPHATVLSDFGQFYGGHQTVALGVAKAPSIRSFKHVAFMLPDHLYGWLESMAVMHNYGSVHKSIRDLLCWACTGQDDDLDWIFLTSHAHIDDDVSCCSTTSSASSSSALSGSEYDDSDALKVAGKQACARLATRMVAVDALVSDALHSWILEMIARYSLQDPSVVLEMLIRCAIELQAADDIFESDECGHDLPESTAELYHDLGLIKHNWSHHL